MVDTTVVLLLAIVAWYSVKRFCREYRELMDELDER